MKTFGKCILALLGVAVLLFCIGKMIILKAVRTVRINNGLEYRHNLVLISV